MLSLPSWTQAYQRRPVLFARNCNKNGSTTIRRLEYQNQNWYVSVATCPGHTSHCSTIATTVPRLLATQLSCLWYRSHRIMFRAIPCGIAAGMWFALCCNLIDPDPPCFEDPFVDDIYDDLLSLSFRVPITAVSCVLGWTTASSSSYCTNRHLDVLCNSTHAQIIMYYR